MKVKSENEEAIPSYRQLNEWLAAMTANEHVKDRDAIVIPILQMKTLKHKSIS